MATVILGLGLKDKTVTAMPVLFPPYHRRGTKLWNQPTWVQILPLLLINCVTLGKLFHLMGLSVCICKIGIIKSSCPLDY